MYSKQVKVFMINFESKEKYLFLKILCVSLFEHIHM